MNYDRGEVHERVGGEYEIVTQMLHNSIFCLVSPWHLERRPCVDWSSKTYLRLIDHIEVMFWIRANWEPRVWKYVFATLTYPFLVRESGIAAVSRAGECNIVCWDSASGKIPAIFDAWNRAFSTCCLCSLLFALSYKVMLTCLKLYWSGISCWRST